ncbi:MAG: DUF2868 domain-containing protein [Myxococcales bacterium]|nr:DUF2868 domain-containing protein [Myxococcales bacterium]
MGALSQRDAQAILVVKALEQANREAPSPELRVLAGSEAGDPRDRERWLVRRAATILERLPQRYRSLAALEIPPGWVTYPLLGVACVAGIATNTLGPTGKIHAFYNPTSLIIVWNLAVVLLIGARALAQRSLARPLLDALAPFFALSERRWRRARRDPAAARSDLELRVAFLREFQSAFSGLIAARGAVLLSAASLAFTSGVLAGMYLRGVAFGYNVVWQSTLVQSPQTALDLLELLFYPAVLLAPESFPDLRVVRQLASPGGAPAGPWIHCFALTALTYAVLPRLAVLAWQQWTAHRLASRVTLDLSDPYYEALFRGDLSVGSGLERLALEGFSLDANQYAVLASLQAGLIETDLRSRPRRFIPAWGTLAKRNRWYAAWKRVVETGWRDAFPESDRPRFLALGSAEFSAAVARAQQTANPFAAELIALELAAFEAYWPLEPVGRSWLGLLKPGALPKLSESARARFFAEMAGPLGLQDELLPGLRRELKAISKELERFWLKLGMGVLSGVAIGGLTLGIAAPFIGGLVGGALGLGGAAAVKAGLAALGGGALAAGGLGMSGGTTVLVGGGALLGGLGSGVLAIRQGGSPVRGLGPGQALLSAVKIEVFLKRIVLPRDPETFRRIVERFEAVAAEYEGALRDLPLKEGVTEKEVDEHAKAVAILERSAARIRGLCPP